MKTLHMNLNYSLEYHLWFFQCPKRTTKKLKYNDFYDMQTLHCSSAGHASTCTLVVCAFLCVHWHASDPMIRGFRAVLRMQFDPAFDHNLDRKGEVKIHEAILNMNENDEIWMLLKFQFDFF